MKFILQEDKFILNEQFLLNERFILNETILLEAQATAKQLVIDVTKLNTLLPELLKYLPIGADASFVKDSVLEDADLDIINEIKTGCKDVLELLNTGSSFQEILKKIQEKASNTEDLYSEEEIKKLQPLCYNIASDGNSVKDRLKSLKNQKGNFGEQLVTLQERLPKLKEGIEELYKFFKKDSPKPPETSSSTTKYYLKNSTLELKVGETAELKVFATPKVTRPVKITRMSVDTTIATIDAKGVITAVAEGKTQIKVTVEGQSLACDVTVVAADEAEEETTSDTSTEKLDWYELYKKCTECENRKQAYAAFWNGGLPKAKEKNPLNLPVVPLDEAAAGYYKCEWGDQAALVRSFGTPFFDTLQEYGWTATLNPFIALLRHLFKFDKIFIDDSSFTVLVNAYRDQIIRESDLRGNSDALGELSLVRNPQFYEKSSAELMDYLRWQSKVKMYNQTPSDSSLQTIYANIVLETGNTKNLKDKAALGVITSAKFKYPVRPIVKYKELIKTKLNLDGDETKVKQATDDEVANIILKVKDASKAKKVLAYLVNYYRVADLKKLTNLLAKPFGAKLKTNRDTVKTTFDEDREFDALLNTTTKKYSQAQLETLITKLIGIAGL